MAADGIPHFADRLNDLFRRIPKPNSAAPYSNDAVAEELGAQGISVTGVYLSQLRSGRKTNPSARLVGGLAKFFGVPVTYFFDEDEAEAIRSQLDALASLRDGRIQGIMTRTQGMSESGFAHLAGIIDHIRSIEGLDRDQGTPKAGDSD